MTFKFDDKKTFSDNLNSYIDELSQVDLEMATIFRQNKDLLLSIVVDGSRDPKARVQFNLKISDALDSLVTSNKQEKI